MHTHTHVSGLFLIVEGVNSENSDVTLWRAFDWAEGSAVLLPLVRKPGPYLIGGTGCQPVNTISSGLVCVCVWSPAECPLSYSPPQTV